MKQRLNNPTEKIATAHSITEGTPEDELLAKDSKHINGDIAITYADLIITNQIDLL